MPKWDIPISYTSGKHMAKRTSTFFGSFTTEFTSPPIYRAGCWMDSKISSLKASFLIKISFSIVYYT